MIHLNILLIGFLFISNLTFGQKEAYVIYDSEGKRVTYETMRSTLNQKDVILFGELHNNPIAHWLQYELTNDLSEERKLILGAEMFEADNQIPLQDYMRDSISYEGLDTLARLWPNYETDYAPLVELAKEKQLPFIATNIPRRYANLVYRNGFEALDSLSKEEKAWLAPLPIPFDSELPTYKNILKELGDHGTPELVKAQAMKDATMAHFILANYQEGDLFIHYNGAYHSDFYEGIIWYLKGYNPELDYANISTASQDNVHVLEEAHIGKADFIICVDSNMTTTY